MHTESRPRDRRSRALVLATLTAAVIGGGLLVAPSALADTTPATTITGTPPSGTFALAYDFTFGAQGFSAPVRFSVDSGTLPGGLQLQPWGELVGTPTTVGPGSPVVVRASDGGVDPDATSSITVPVDPAPPTWSQTPPATVTIPVGVSYYLRYATAPNVVPSTFSASDGLPPGLSFDQYGELSGTPTTTGTYSFTVTASDGAVSDLTAATTIVVMGTGPSISGDAPDAIKGDYYDFTYTLGGSPTPSTKVISGQLPDGLALDGNGTLTGGPTTAGTYTFTVEADNIVGPPATLQDTITIQQPAISITGTPPAAAVGEPYDFGFTTAGTSLVGIYVGNGTPPPGTQLIGEDLMGTPTRAGRFSFTVTLADAMGDTATDHVTLRVLPVPTLSVAGSRLAEGNSGTHPMTFTVRLSRPSSVPVTVRWATANGTARAGSDYVAGSGTLTFAPGQTTRTVTVLVKGDRTKEKTETFAVHLSSPTHAALGSRTATGTIVNDD